MFWINDENEGYSLHVRREKYDENDSLDPHGHHDEHVLHIQYDKYDLEICKYQLYEQ